MKKYAILLLTALFGLASCGSDDKPYVKPLNRLTKVTCTMQETGQTMFAADITYMADGRVAYIRLDGRKQQFIYVGNTLTVSGDGMPATVKYTLSGNAITAKEVSKKNEYAPNVEYVSDTYAYQYTGSNMDRVDWTVRWPNPDGLTYDDKPYTEHQTFKWENGNVTAFMEERTVLKYEYSGRLRPSNLPFRVVDTFAPIGFEVFSPVNMMMGGMNRELPERAFRYKIPDTSVVEAEYEFDYTATVGDYLTGLTIKEKEDGRVIGTYVYTFEYNYASN